MKQSHPIVLPHYKLVTDGELFEHIKHYLGEAIFDVLYGSLADLDKSAGEIITTLMNLPSLAKVFGLEQGGDVSSTTGVTAPLRYLATKGKTFEIDPDLNFLLEQTDIGNKAPGSIFQLPFNSLYIHMPKSTIPITDSDDPNKSLPLSGIYVNEVFQDDFEIRCRTVMGETGPCRGFEFVFVSEGTPENALDSNFMHSRFIIPDAWSDDSIESIVSRQMDTFDELGLRGDKNAYVEFKRSMLELISHLVKCLLFINSQDAILKEEPAHSDIEARLLRVKPAKKAKIKQQLKRAYDKIHVSHHTVEDDQTPYDPDNSSHSMRSHWRRGHFRQQAYGKGRIDRKMLWIRPMLIHGGLKEESAKTYTVTN